MNPEQGKTIQKVADEVRQKLEGEGSGHDWWHIVRVWNMAKHIGKSESADIFVANFVNNLGGHRMVFKNFPS